MKQFLKSLDQRVWLSTKKGWNKRQTKVEKLSKDQLNECNWSNKGQNVIFMVVSQEQFKIISLCENAMETWDILEITHEETKNVKKSKLQKFEEISLKPLMNFMSNLLTQKTLVLIQVERSLIVNNPIVNLVRILSLGKTLEEEKKKKKTLGYLMHV